MFTGIIQTSGKISALQRVGDALQMTISTASSNSAKNFFAQCKEGDSVSNNGVCLTIEKNASDEATFTLIKQTLDNTAFRLAAIGDLVNLEFPCRPDSLMGGHFVMGHIDSAAEVKQIIPRETGLEVDLEIPLSISKYIIKRGSIALNGISLTVAEKPLETQIRVAIIPETIRITNIGNWKIGDLINVEVDMLGKYVENFINLKKEM